MEENTMGKNGAEESHSASDEQGAALQPESGQTKGEQRMDASGAGQTDTEHGTVKSRSGQPAGHTGQTGSTRGTGRRRAVRTTGEEWTGRRRAVRATEEERMGSRRAGQAAGEERTGSRRAVRVTEEERTGSRRAVRMTEEERTGSRRASRTAEDGRSGSRVTRTSREAGTGSHGAGQVETAQQISKRLNAEYADKRDEERTAAAHAERSVSAQERPIRVASLEREESRSRQREAESAKFGLGHKKTRRSAIAYFFEDIAEAFVRAKNWCVRNYRTSIPAAICLVLVIVVACILVRNFRMQPAPVSEDAGTLAEEYPLEQDAYEHVNSFFQRYYEASTFGDVDTYASMRSYTDAAERIRMQKKANYIDYYQNLSCYTKPGPVENSYLVYVYYEVKFRGINTLAPGLKTFYLCTNENGELYVFSGDVDQNVKDYMRTVSTQEDVKDLFNRVKVTYNNAVASDKALEDFLATLAENLKDEVTLALKEEEQNQSQENAGNEDGSGEDTEPDPATEEPEPTPEPEQQPDRVVTTDRVNVRSSASPEATKLGTVAAGTQFTRYETLENGWSKIDYEGGEAYIKTEYLQVVEAAVGKVKAIESVNIRASASEDATKLGTVSAGTTLDLIENQENGWSRILFNGSTAYVKTEYLDIENMTE